LFALYPVIKLGDRFLHRAVVVRNRVGVHCPQCGYNLEGNVSGKCPECGASAAIPGAKDVRATVRGRCPECGKLVEIRNAEIVERSESAPGGKTDCEPLQ
jgi:DNA-directed RNA polymerase subunit RPC12/RpoP